MKKSAVIAVVVLGVMPFSACSNGEQSAYMEHTSIEANALEAEQAEQEFAEQAATHGEDQSESHGKQAKATAKKVTKAESKKVAKAEPKMASVEKNKTRKPASVSQTGSTSGVWVVQLGAFRVKENAEKLTAKLKTDGYPVLMKPLNHSKNGQLYVVSLEPTPSKKEAQKWQSELKAKSFDTNVVAHKD